MAPLPPELRGLLERAVIDAREEAEKAALAAVGMLAVDRPEPHASMGEGQKRLRNALRARARQLGNGVVTKGIEPLVEEVAYQQWHRMLFARFLAENGLLMHPSGVAVTLEECGELAAEEGEPDGWMLAARYASAMLPGIFRQEDPASQLRFAPEGRQVLEGFVGGLPAVLFTSDDGLGWVYQFWQTKKKREVNQSGRKIGGEDLFAVTQLFTEDYMVRFLLENSLGAWWVTRHPDSPLLKRFGHLRFKDDGTPAAGSFPGWPERAAEVTVMDPCPGSGHFLVAAFEMLRAMRMEEEGLSEAEAGDVVLRDNLFGLEIDPRCVQIAAFALALAGWKAGGYRPLPLPNLACSGISVEGQLEEWKKLADGDTGLEWTLERLHSLFKNAPDLGSLINPADVPVKDRMFAPDYSIVESALAKALARERSHDPAAAVFGTAAQGVARAARLLTARYTLVSTNVPYLGRGSQTDILKAFSDLTYPDAKADLATVFVERCRALAADSGCCALVTPQNWLLIASYCRLREKLLRTTRWLHVSRLGVSAFDTIGGEVVNVALLLLENRLPSVGQIMTGLDVTQGRSGAEKSDLLRSATLQHVQQAAQLANPDARVTLQNTQGSQLLSRYAASYQGIKTGDDARYKLCFWELSSAMRGWRLAQGTSPVPAYVSGLHYALDWREDGRNMARLQGLSAWGKAGIAISSVASLAGSIYMREPFTRACYEPQIGSDRLMVWKHANLTRAM